jgi:tetratricopeptide (TPR) repeat protein
VAAFHEAVTIKPDYAIGWYNLGVASGRRGEHAAAAGCYRKALELDPRNVDGWVNLSIEYQTLGDFNAAVRASQEALKIRPEDPLALGALVTAHWNRGDAVQARAAFERLRAANPAAAEALARKLRAANN